MKIFPLFVVILVKILSRSVKVAVAGKIYKDNHKLLTFISFVEELGVKEVLDGCYK